MKKILFFCTITLCVLLLADTTLAQRRGGGGGGFRGGGGGGFSGGGAGRAGFTGGGAANFNRPASLPGGNFGEGSVVHHSAAPSSRPGAGGSGTRDFSNIRPGAGGAGTRDLPNTRPGSDWMSRSPSDRGRDIDPNSAKQLLQDHGFKSANDFKNVLQEKGIHGPDDVRKTLDDRNIRNRDSLQNALSNKDFDLTKIDKNQLNETVRNRLNNHPINVDNSTNVNYHPENNVMRRDSINNVRQQFNDNNPNWQQHYWNNNWYNSHPGAWYPHAVMPAAWWGPAPTWDHAWGWFAAGVITGAVADAILTPYPYNYGTNIYYSGDMVYANGTPYVSADEYYEQACDLADAGDTTVSTGSTNITINTGNTGETPTNDSATQTAADKEEWLPMGTYAVLKDPDDKDCKRVIQLAISKTGKVAGNLVDIVSDKSVAIMGSVDQKTQRVAFHAPDHDAVAECGLWNLTQDSLTMLLHLSKDKTEERTLVRLADAQKPEAEK